jgi:hypothetical protein
MNEDLTDRVHGGSATSAEAFARTPEGKRKSQRERILTTLHLAKPDGRTSKELTAALGIGHQSMGARILELIDAGKAHRPGGDCRRDGAMVVYAGPGETERRATADGVSREKYEALVIFAKACRKTIEKGRIQGEGVEKMDARLRSLGY